MDGIESIGTSPALASASALQRMGQVALRQRTANVTAQEVADSPDERKQQLAKDFEAVLLTRLFDQVRESIQESGFDDDAASGQIRGMFWSYLAQDVADKGGFGLWRSIYEHFQDLEGRQATGELINKEL